MPIYTVFKIECLRVKSQAKPLQSAAEVTRQCLSPCRRTVAANTSGICGCTAPVIDCSCF